MPAILDPSLSEDILALAGKITVPDDSADRRELAISIAAAQIELMRVRQARHQMLVLALSDPEEWTPSKAMLRRRGHGRQAPVSPETPLPIAEADIRDPGKVASVLADLSVRMLALDRYERRALSRRKRAIRNFDALGKSGAKRRPIRK